MKSKKPNILFLFTDDQRYNTIKALGNKDIYTPHIDELVKKGTAFTNAYIMGGSCEAVCMPSRAMLMTGRYLFHLEEQGQEIPEDHVLLGEALQKQGYSTFGVGKWHNGTSSYTRSFTDGAEIFFGGMDDHWNVPACDFSPTGDYPDPVERRAQWHLGEDKKLVKSRFDHIKSGKHSTELFADAAVKYLDEYNQDNPFFMYISFMAPHDPRTMPEKYLEMYDPADITLPENFMPEHPFDNGELDVRDEGLADRPRKPEEIKSHIAAYYGMISHLDDEIGRILDKLRETGEYDNTIIILAGDNGLALGSHGLMGKQNLYEESVKVPLIFSGPGIEKNRQIDSFAYLIDIYPTICEMIKAPIPDTVDGTSLLPLLIDKEDKVRDKVFCAYRNYQRSIRDEKWKLIEYFVGDSYRKQLFNLEEDKYEMNDLSSDKKYQYIIENLRDQMKNIQEEIDDPLAGRYLYNG